MAPPILNIATAEASECCIREIKSCYPLNKGYAGVQLVEALHYKPEGRGFDSRCFHWNFLLT